MQRVGCVDEIKSDLMWISQAILDTKTHKPTNPNDPDTLILLDIDMSILRYPHKPQNTLVMMNVDDDVVGMWIMMGVLWRVDDDVGD
jgi:hypothetical protein